MEQEGLFVPRTALTDEGLLILGREGLSPDDAERMAPDALLERGRERAWRIEAETDTAYAFARGNILILDLLAERGQLGTLGPLRNAGHRYLEWQRMVRDPTTPGSIFLNDGARWMLTRFYILQDVHGIGGADGPKALGTECPDEGGKGCDACCVHTVERAIVTGQFHPNQPDYRRELDR